jgi:hypothetical protein
VNGVDVFHPNTGEVRSDGADGIACWFIDTDYNEESFFVRHAYFLGAADRAGDLRGWIGRVIESAMFYRAGNREIGDARLDNRESVVEVDLLDIVEFHHGKENAVLERQGAARQPMRTHLREFAKWRSECTAN